MLCSLIWKHSDGSLANISLSSHLTASSFLPLDFPVSCVVLGNQTDLGHCSCVVCSAWLMSFDIIFSMIFFPEHYFRAVGGPFNVDILNHQNVSMYYMVNDNLYVFLILEKSDFYRLSHTITCCSCRFILRCFLHQSVCFFFGTQNNVYNRCLDHENDGSDLTI